MSAFNLAALIGKSTILKGFRGTDFSYKVIATKGKSQLSINVNVEGGGVLIKGKSLACLGITVRMISMVEADFKDTFGMGLRGTGYFKSEAEGEEGVEVKGSRLMKSFLPVLQAPCSPVDFKKSLKGIAYPSLAKWIIEKVTADGGTMLVDEAFLTEFFMATVANMPDESVQMFHLPDQKPTYAPELVEPDLPTYSGVHTVSPFQETITSDEPDVSDDDQPEYPDDEEEE